MRIETAPGGAFRPVPAIDIEAGGWILTRTDSAPSRGWHRVRGVINPFPDVLHVALETPNGGIALEIHGLYDPVIYQAGLPTTPTTPTRDVRAALQAAFGRTPFRVRPMVDGASVGWDDGPTPRQVVDVVKTVESCWRWRLHRKLGILQVSLTIARAALAADDPDSWQLPPGRLQDQPCITDATDTESVVAHRLAAMATSRRQTPQSVLREIGLQALQAP